MPERKTERKLKSESGIKFLFVLVSLIFISQTCSAQELSNLDIFFRLTDSVVVSLVRKLPQSEKTVYLKTSMNNSYSVFENKIISLLKDSGKTVLTVPDTSGPAVSLAFEEAKVYYPDMFRDGFFGPFMVKREVLLKGNYIISLNGRVTDTRNFKYRNEDTVGQNDLKTLENSAYPFTRGEMPPEPVFSSLLEPVIALGTAAAVIYLFFTIRSK